MDTPQQLPSWQRFGGSPANLLNRLVPEMKSSIFTHEIRLQQTLDAPFAREEFDVLLRTRREVAITVTKRFPDYENGGWVEDCDVMYWRSTPPPSTDENVEVVGAALDDRFISYNVAVNHMIDEIVATDRPMPWLDAFLDYLSRTDFASSTTRLLDIKSIFFLYKKRAENTGLASAVSFARQRTMGYLERLVNFFRSQDPERYVSLRMYLLSCLINAELIDTKDVYYEDGVLTREFLAEVKIECDGYYGLLRDEIEYLR